MPVIDRTLWFNGLIDDDGTGVVGTVWQKSEIAKFLDSIDAALAGSFTPTAHAASHKSGGADSLRLDELASTTDTVLLNSTVSAHGLLPKLSGSTTLFLRGDGTWASAVSPHHASHEAGGTDPVKLDDLSPPDDNLDLDASLLAHGLLPKLPGGTSSFLRADGTFAVPSGVTPAAHAATHGSGGTDPITIAESQVTNLSTDLTAITTNKADKTDPRFTDARVPTLHAASHKSGGGDVIKLDELGPTSDVVTLNSSVFSHGLLPKLPGTTTVFLRGDGTFAAPTSTPGVHATTHYNAGSDPVDIASLAGFPGNTTAFLRADGQFVVPPNGSAGGGNVTGPVTSVVGHLASFNNATGTLIADTGIAQADVVVTTDTRLSNARTPTAHAASHAAAGSDPVTIAESQVSNLVTDLAAKVDTTDARLSDARTPTAHATTHKSGGTDALRLDELASPTDTTVNNVSSGSHGLAPKLPGNTTTFLRGDGSYATPTGITPSAHHTTHEAGGADAIKLDDLAAPDDTTDLDASTAKHGLLQKLPGGTTTFLRADGTFAAPAAAAPAAHATTHKSGGTDAIKLDELAAPTDVTTLNASISAHGLLQKLPGGTTTFLRADGTFAAAGAAPTEGSWTPGITPGSGSGITYTTQAGSYIKIGRWVICTFILKLSSIGTAGSSAATLSGLPFTSDSGSVVYYNFLEWNGLAVNAHAITAQVIPGNTTASLIRTTAAGVDSLQSTMGCNDLGATGGLRGTIQYLAST